MISYLQIKLRRTRRGTGKPQFFRGFLCSSMFWLNGRPLRDGGVPVYVVLKRRLPRFGYGLALQPMKIPGNLCWPMSQPSPPIAP
jgi:hypothetical protein